MPRGSHIVFQVWKSRTFRSDVLHTDFPTEWTDCNGLSGNAQVTLCRLGFPIRPDFEVGVSRGSVCLSRGELGIRRGRVGRVGIGREGTPTKYYM